MGTPKAVFNLPVSQMATLIGCGELGVSPMATLVGCGELGVNSLNVIVGEFGQYGSSDSPAR